MAGQLALQPIFKQEKIFLLKTVKLITQVPGAMEQRHRMVFICFLLGIKQCLDLVDIIWKLCLLLPLQLVMLELQQYQLAIFGMELVHTIMVLMGATRFGLVGATRLDLGTQTQVCRLK